MICASIVTSSAVVGSSRNDEIRLAGERCRDEGALLHAAAQLMRKRVRHLTWAGKAHLGEDGEGALAALCGAEAEVHGHGLRDLPRRPGARD